MTCRWDCPHYWLYDRMARAIREDDCDWLESTIRSLADSLDHDTLQDIFEREMDDDGYFGEMPMMQCPDTTCRSANICEHGKPHRHGDCDATDYDGCPNCVPVEEEL